jgi:Na+/H+ antiporter NhaC
MATAILQSLKHGAYTAIALYVVFIAVVTVTSMNPQLTTPNSVSAQSSVVELDRAVANTQERAS